MLTWLNEQFGELCETLNSLPVNSPLEGLKSSFVEGIDIVLLILTDESMAWREDKLVSATELISDRGELMRNIRATYLLGDLKLDETEKAHILTITNNVEQIFFLLSKLAQEIQGSEGIPERCAEGSGDVTS